MDVILWHRLAYKVFYVTKWCCKWYCRCVPFPTPHGSHVLVQSLVDSLINMCANETNLRNQIFSQVERAMYPLQIYNTKSLMNCYYASIFCKDLWHFKHAMITHVIGLDYFFFDYCLWFPLAIFSTTTNFFKQQTFDMQIQCGFSLEWSH
jgi:hypothetical protein